MKACKLPPPEEIKRCNDKIQISKNQNLLCVTVIGSLSFETKEYYKNLGYTIHVNKPPLGKPAQESNLFTWS